MTPLDIRPRPLVVGGIPSLDDIVGRDREVSAALQSISSGHGCLLTGDRRFGKTSLMRLVERAAQAQGYAVVRVSAERASLNEFIAALASSLSAANGAVKRELDRWSLAISAGVVSGQRERQAPSLDELVRLTIGAIGRQKLVVLVDEVPVLAGALNARSDGSGTEFLHLLRRLRQDFSGQLAMVLSGSIGFHHVAGIDKVNDLEKIAVGPIDVKAAEDLARSLLFGQSMWTHDAPNLAYAIAVASEAVPYYVHQLVKSCLTRAKVGGHVTANDVPHIVGQALADNNDPWDMGHYYERISDYYGEDQQPLVVAVLDLYADADFSLSVEDVMRLLGATQLELRPGKRQLIELLRKLDADHYLTLTLNRRRFASELVRRAWIAQRY